MEYIKKLQEFKGANGNKKNLDIQFEQLANYFLKEGYFMVNGKRKIYICDVEFYYHEEYPNGIKDWIMYHRNRTNSKGIFEKKDYFKMGQLNAHTSGIDITFENKHEEYRASMLIRGFKIDNIDAPNNQRYDKRSTYFYEALLNQEILYSKLIIEWVEKDDHPYRNETPEIASRINVFKYNKEGEKTNIRCNRPWRFHFKLRK